MEATEYNRKPWINQKSQKEQLGTTVLNSICYAKGIPITETVTNKLFEEINSFKDPSFQDLAQVLDRFGIESISIKVEIEKLFDLKIPIIALINSRISNRPETIFIFHITENETVLLSPSLGWRSTKTEEFKNEFSGYAVLLKYELTSVPQFKNFDDSYYSHHQKIELLPNFLSSQECDHIIEISNAKFQQSKVIGQNGEIIDDIRNRSSYSAMLNSFPNDPILNNIYNKVSKLLNYPIDNIEYLQCVRYEEEQFFNFHFDTFNYKGYKEKEDNNFQGQRIITILVYLNDDFFGGETSFPNMRRRVLPKKGLALKFYNLRADGEVDTDSLHGGLPVFKGVKYALNIWINNTSLKGTKYSPSTVSK